MGFEIITCVHCGEVDERYFQLSTDPHSFDMKSSLWELTHRRYDKITLKEG